MATTDLELERSVAERSVRLAVGEHLLDTSGRVLGREIVEIDRAVVAGDRRRTSAAEEPEHRLAEDLAGEVVQREVEGYRPLVDDADVGVEDVAHAHTH